MLYVHDDPDLRGADVNHSTGSQLLCKGALFAVAALVAGECVAQSAPSAPSAQGCPEIPQYDEDGALLTRAERIARLDKALLDLLNSDSCRLTPSAVGGSASGGGSGGGSSDALSGSEGTADTASGVQSIPVEGIQGDVAVVEPPRADQEAADDPLAANTPDQSGLDPTLPNGKLPEDIPPVDSDDIIAKQFRQAALEETDPKVQAKLWNEYRRYKGLPVQDEAENEGQPSS